MLDFSLPDDSQLVTALREGVLMYFRQLGFRWVSLSEALDVFSEILHPFVLKAIDALAREGKLSLSPVDRDVAIRWVPSAEHGRQK